MGLINEFYKCVWVYETLYTANKIHQSSERQNSAMELKSTVTGQKLKSIR